MIIHELDCSGSTKIMKFLNISQPSYGTARDSSPKENIPNFTRQVQLISTRIRSLNRIIYYNYRLKHILTNLADSPLLQEVPHMLTTFMIKFIKICEQFVLLKKQTYPQNSQFYLINFMCYLNFSLQINQFVLFFIFILFKELKPLIKY